MVAAEAGNEYSGFEKTVALLPKFTGGLSFLFSLYIVQHVLRSKKRRAKTYHRLLLGMSLCDMLASFFGFVLSTAPMPVGTTYGAIGSFKSCDVAGTLNHAGNLATPLYNSSLATYYVCVLVLGYKEHELHRRIEPLLHLVPLACAWGTAIAGYWMNLYAAANWICWIAPYPPDCKDSYTFGADEGTCVRGDNAWLYRWAFLYAEVWFAILYVTAAMALIYYTVLRVERSTDKYRHLNNPSSSSRRRSLPKDSLSSIFRRRQKQRISLIKRKRQQSKQVAHQALAYVGAFFLTWIFGTIARLMQQSKEDVSKSYRPLLLLQTIFFPLQGFFNALVYLRPRFVQYREAHKKKQEQQEDFNQSWCQFLCMAIWTGCSQKVATKRARKVHSRAIQRNRLHDRDTKRAPSTKAAADYHPSSSICFKSDPQVIIEMDEEEREGGGPLASREALLISRQAAFRRRSADSDILHHSLESHQKVTPAKYGENNIIFLCDGENDHARGSSYGSKSNVPRSPKSPALKGLSRVLLSTSLQPQSAQTRPAQRRASSMFHHPHFEEDCYDDSDNDCAVAIGSIDSTKHLVRNDNILILPPARYLKQSRTIGKASTL
jgi:hypothetical protein